MIFIRSLGFLILLTNLAFAQIENQAAVNALIPLDQIEFYQNYPIQLKQLIANAQTLIKQNLTYTYGSADPKNKGMDCSGTIYYLLRSVGVNNVPRQSDKIYEWAKANGKFYSTSAHDINAREFSNLKPGDLLFWSGTYKTDHTLGISHVMIYLGKTKDGKLIMFGSSDGRTYQNKQMWGVSVFDFKLPQADSVSRFLGYSCIPELTCT